VHIRPLVVPDSFEITPRQHPDDRGTFLEWFKAEVFEQETGHRLGLGQANCSVSRRGVLRGVHFSDVPPGQAKYVTCFVGQVLDVVVDLRVGSPTFAAVDAVLLDDEDRRAVYLAEGLGHAFLVLSETATVAYLCSTPYAPAREHGLNPLDPDLDLPWPGEVTPVLSPKDADAPGLERATKDGLLPRYDDCRAWYRSDR
jgi:dTDP-4-dehydrorhamnose 3,5-epimerase